MLEMGFSGKSVVYPDLAFSLPEDSAPNCRMEVSRKPVVGVGLFDYEGRGALGAGRKHLYCDYIRKISAFVAYLVKRGHPVRILIGDMLYDNPVRDDLRTSLTAIGIEYNECDITDEPVSSVTNLLDQIATTDMVIATRYHNVVLALMLHKPVISISYEKKNDSLMGDLGLSDYCQRLDRFDLGRLKEQFVHLEKNAENLRMEIERKTGEYRGALVEQYSIIFTPPSPTR